VERIDGGDGCGGEDGSIPKFDGAPAAASGEERAASLRRGVGAETRTTGRRRGGGAAASGEEREGDRGRGRGRERG